MGEIWGYICAMNLLKRTLFFLLASCGGLRSFAQTAPPEPVYDAFRVDSMSWLEGGSQALTQFVTRNWHFAFGDQDSVMVSFVVEKGGSLEDYSINILPRYREIKLDNSLLQITGNMPGWHAALRDNKPVACRYTLIIGKEPGKKNTIAAVRIVQPEIRVMTMAEQMPVPSVAIKSYLEENLHYPTQALKNKTEGKVSVRVTILSTGRVKQVEALNELPDGCKEEALRLIRNIHWQPAKQNGQTVNCFYTVSVPFTLPGTSTEK